jgi:hypothetical protein
MAVVLPFVATFVDKGAKQAIQSIKKVESQWGKTGNTIKKMGAPAAAVGGALVAALGSSRKAAGAAAKSQKVLRSALTNSGFPESEKAASDYAVTMSKTTGIDANSIRMAQAKLVTNKELAKDTEKLGKVTMLAADMSAQGFGSMESASNTLTKALADPVKGMAALARQGIVFDEATKKAVKTAVEAGDTLGAQQLVLAKVQDVVGGAAEKTASKTDILRAKYTDLAVQIGTMLMPAFSKLVEILTKVVDWMMKNQTTVKVLIVVIGGLVTTILLLNAAMKIQQIMSSLFSAGKTKEAATTAIANNATRLNTAAMTTNTTGKTINRASTVRLTSATVIQTGATTRGTLATKLSTIATRLATAAQRTWTTITKLATTAWRLLNAALKANPIGAVVTAVMLLVAALKYAWNHSETFRRIVTNAFNAVKDVAQRVFSAISGAIQPVIDALSRIIGLAQDVAGAIGNVISKLPGLRNAKSEAEAAAPTGAAMGRAAHAGTYGGSPVYITIQGALDPERVGRQIRDILDGHDLRQGRVVTRAVAW